MKTPFVKLSALVFSALLLASGFASAEPRRKVIINQDCSGPGGSNLQTLLVMIQSPQIEVLGITVVSGDQWRDEEVAHTLRLLEIIGRTDIPVVPGAAFPLVRTREEAQRWQDRYGKVAYAGAWDAPPCSMQVGHRWSALRMPYPATAPRRSASWAMPGR